MLRVLFISLSKIYLNPQELQSLVVDNSRRIPLADGKDNLVRLHGLRRHRPQEALHGVAAVVVPHVLPRQLGTSLGVERFQVRVDQLALAAAAVLDGQSAGEEGHQVKKSWSVLETLPVDEARRAVVSDEGVADVVVAVDQRVEAHVRVGVLPQSLEASLDALSVQESLSHRRADLLVEASTPGLRLQQGENNVPHGVGQLLAVLAKQPGVLGLLAVPRLAMEAGQLLEGIANAAGRPGLQRRAEGALVGDVGHDDDALAVDGVGAAEPDPRQQHVDDGGNVVVELGLAAVRGPHLREVLADDGIEAALDADALGNVRLHAVGEHQVYEQLGRGAVADARHGEVRDGHGQDVREPLGGDLLGRHGQGLVRVKDAPGRLGAVDQRVCHGYEREG